MPDPIIISRRLMLAAAATFALSAPAEAQRRRAQPSAKQALPLVMLDPGHGGKDPGAIGVSGIYEKHIALATAQELRRQLLASGRCRVALTRARDQFIALDDRVAIAQRQAATLFVSMHADALTDRRVRGASVYTLSDTASDAQTEALAQRENAAGGGAPQFQDLPPDVAQILSSLVRQEARYGSVAMARNVVDAFGSRLNLLSNPSRHANFAVLKSSDVPSVLVEMGFMSNRRDEALLRRADYRVQVAGALRSAIEGFLAGGNDAVQVAAG